MTQQAQALEHASVRQYCKAVKVPVVGANFGERSTNPILRKIPSRRTVAP